MRKIKKFLRSRKYKNIRNLIGFTLIQILPWLEFALDYVR
jgi:hypothetical protein